MDVSTFTYGISELVTPPPVADLQQLREPCIESHPLGGTVNQYTGTIIWANEPAKTPQQLLNHRIMKAFKAPPKTSCTSGIIAGTAASLLTKNPLPLLAGLSECFPRVSAQQKVGNEFQVNSYTNGRQDNPSVASFSNGNFVVTWMSYGQDGSNYGVYGQLFDGNGSKIGSEFRANSYTVYDQNWPSVASFSNGNFVVAWTSWLQDGDQRGVFGQLFNETGSKIESEFQVNTYTIERQAIPSVASFRNDNFIVTWQSYGQDGLGYGVYGQLFYGNRSKLGNEFQVNTYTTNDQDWPSVESFPNGNFVVAWESFGQDGSWGGVFAQLFNGNGSKIGSEFRVNTYTNNWQDRLSLTTLKEGNFVVTWDSEQDGSSSGIFAQLFDGNGNKIGSEFLVNTYTLNGQFKSSVTDFSNNDFVATWGSWQDGSANGIYGQLFNGNGSKFGDEFQINTYIVGNQHSPSIASLGNENFVVTWISDDQDGNLTGIFGRAIL